MNSYSQSLSEMKKLIQLEVIHVRVNFLALSSASLVCSFSNRTEFRAFPWFSSHIVAQKMW